MTDTPTPPPAPSPTEPDAAVDVAALLAAYDAELRIEGEVARATSVERHGPLHWAVFPRGGFVTYQDLGGATGADLDALVDATIAHYRDAGVAEFEWKTRGHDQPADLGERLVARGLVAEPEESVMVGDAALLALDLPLPEGVTLRRAGDGGGDLLDDVRRACAMQQAVFGGGSGPDPDRLATDIAAKPDELEMWLAEADGEVVCAGRLDRVAGTRFAGIWGGACVEGWRGRGIYRALTADRARSALRMGARYIHSDSTEMSRPILERSGLVRVTTTTPYVWKASH